MTIASLLLALIVTTAAEPTSGEPVLLDFHASWCVPCKTMRPHVARLAEKNYPIQSVDIDQSPDLAQRYNVTAVPTFIVADPQGRVLARTQGVLPPADLAAFYNKATAQYDANSTRETQATADRTAADSAPGEGQPGSQAAAANPLPWETVVRIKMHLSSKEWGFGSGTIIYSDADESIILTCAHIFRDARGQATPVSQFRTKISVDLFDGKIPNYKNPQLKCVEENIAGQAIDYDFNNDVGLIRIRPGRRLPASRVVPATWEPKRGTKMYSVGCSHGKDATAWDTRILDPRVQMAGGKKPFFEMKCSGQPAQGRSGGGLYTTDGYVAGVCDFADPNDNVGLYAVPTAIHQLLDRNQLTALYKAPSDGPNRLLAATTRNRTKIRAQSADDPAPAVAAEDRNFTIPEPDRFKIAPPETRVAANSNRSAPWRNSDLDPTPKASLANRRPDRDGGESVDPGPRPGTAMPTDLAVEPNSDATILDLPDPEPAPRKPAPAAAPRRAGKGGWTPVPSARVRPDTSN